MIRLQKVNKNGIENVGFINIDSEFSLDFEFNKKGFYVTSWTTVSEISPKELVYILESEGEHCLGFRITSKNKNKEEVQPGGKLKKILENENDIAFFDFTGASCNVLWTKNGYLEFAGRKKDAPILIKIFKRTLPKCEQKIKDIEEAVSKILYLEEKLMRQ